LLSLRTLYKPVLARILFILLFVLPTILLAQTKAGGIVQDSNGDAVPYATVYFKNSSKGTLSDENGKFYLESDSDFSALVISFMGYKTVKLNLEKRTNLGLQVVLEYENAALDEVIIVTG